MYIDWTYIILVLPAVLFTMWASANVKSTYNRYSRQQNSRGMTGAQAARRVLDANGLQNVAIQQIEGELTDHYDPKANMIRLSADVYSGTSTAAIGVACPRSNPHLRSGQSAHKSDFLLRRSCPFHGQN